MKVQAAFVISCIMLFCGCAGKKAPPYLDTPESFAFSGYDVPFDGRLQVAAFNIERGVHLEEVIEYLKELAQSRPATIIMLSECDKYHSRSNDRYIAREIAQALGMDMVFAVEYVEYNDGTKHNQATHGNAILSPFPLTEVSVIRHTPVFSWSRYGWLFGQPRDGGVVALGATVNLPDGQKVRAYSLHLESMAVGIQNKKQIMDVLPEAETYEMPLIMGGDLNTTPGSELFKATKKHGIKNAFENDDTPTGWCFFADKKNDTLKCLFKIDWILYRDLELLKTSIQPLPARSGGRVSDHAAVSAEFKLTQKP